MARNLTDKEKQSILQRIKDGVHWTEIVKEFNTSTMTIFKLKKAGEVKQRKPYKARITSHVPLTHIRNGESFIMDCF